MRLPSGDQAEAQLELFAVPRRSVSPVFRFVIVASMRESPSANGKPVAEYWWVARETVSAVSTV